MVVGWWEKSEVQLEVELARTCKCVQHQLPAPVAVLVLYSFARASNFSFKLNIYPRFRWPHGWQQTVAMTVWRGFDVSATPTLSLVEWLSLK